MDGCDINLWVLSSDFLRAVLLVGLILLEERGQHFGERVNFKDPVAMSQGGTSHLGPALQMPMAAILIVTSSIHFD